MKYQQIIKENLNKIIKELHEELKKDNTIYQFIDSDFTLEKLFNIQRLLAEEYFTIISNENISEYKLNEFYNKTNVVYPVIYKCMSALKIKILTYLDSYNVSKENIIEFGKKFDIFNNLLAKIYIKNDIHLLEDLKNSPFKKYVMYKAHVEWINKIIFAIENEKMEEYPLINAKNCEFSKILSYPESLMVCIDMNKCSYLHDLHVLLHKSANSVYVSYIKEEYIQAYMVFKELKEQAFKFISTISELYFIAYSDLENVFFNFLALVSEQKEFFVNLIDFRNLKSLNSIYGKENITKAINKIEEKLKNYLLPRQDKCVLIRGITANFYLYSTGISKKEYMALLEDIENIIKKEIKTASFNIKFDYIITALLVKSNSSYSSSDDLVKILIYLKNKAKEENKKVYLAIDETEVLKVKKWLNQKYNFNYIENKLKNKELDIVFQPIVNNKTEEFEFFETLVRIKEGKNLISAGIFIDKVYEMNKITELDLLVLDFIEKKLPLIKKLTDIVFVNVSFVSLLNEKYIEKFEKIIKKIDIVLELTEQKMVENLETIIELNEKYKINFAIDDFGSGYSSLKTVVDLAKNNVIKFLKIDGTLIQNMDKDIYLEKVTKIISVLGEELNLRVIAEFVENEKVLELLQKIGVELSQGFYLEKPTEVEILLAKKSGVLDF